MTDPKKEQAEQAELPLDTTPSPAQGTSPEEEPDDGDTLEWSCHPVRRRPLVSVAVTLFIVVCGILVHLATESRFFTILALVVLYASLAKFYFPTRYRFNSKGIRIKTTTQTLFKDWSLYRSFYPDKNGVLLSTFAHPTRLENFRGLYVMFDNNRDEVLDFVRRYVGATDEPAGEVRS